MTIGHTLSWGVQLRDVGCVCVCVCVCVCSRVEEGSQSHSAKLGNYSREYHSPPAEPKSQLSCLTPSHG